MAPDFGAQGDGWEGAVGWDVDRVGYSGPEGGDEEGGCGGEVGDARDGREEVPVYEFFLGDPGVDTVVVVNGVLVRVVPSFLSTRRSSEEVRVKVGLWKDLGQLDRWGLDELMGV